MNKRPDNPSDRQLVEMTKKNPDEFKLIVDRYWNPLFRYLRRMSFFKNEDIEDLLQEVFIKVYKNINAYDSALKFSSWIYQITRNAFIDEIRKRKTRPLTFNLEDEEILNLFRSNFETEHNLNDLALKLDLNSELEQMKKLIEKMPLKYKEVLILKFLEEKNYDEIMDIIKKPKGTVASLINRGRKILLQDLKRSTKKSQ